MLGVEAGSKHLMRTDTAKALETLIDGRTSDLTQPRLTRAQVLLVARCGEATDADLEVGSNTWVLCPYSLISAGVEAAIHDYKTSSTCEVPYKGQKCSLLGMAWCWDHCSPPALPSSSTC